MTDDPGMKDMLNFLIARDTMHQQQWLAVLEELGPEMATNAPGDYANAPEHRDEAYTFINHLMDTPMPADARWTSGPSLDGVSEFRLEEPAKARGQEPDLQKAPPEIHAGLESTLPDGDGGSSAAARFTRGLGNVMDKVTPGQ
jgi:Mn-containing catalase